MPKPERSALFAKIYGCLLGGAIGDAMGGPVEGWNYQQIQERYGHLDRLLPYEKEPAEHNHWAKQAGAYTDDTRLKHVLCQCILERGDVPERGDFVKALADYYYSHDKPIERGFIEEYFLKSLYGARKLIYGGHPTNGAIMMNSPLGLIHACRPRQAFATAFELAFITDGYAKESAAIAAAAVATAMRPDATVDSIIDEALEAAAWHRREGPLWPVQLEKFPWARFEGRPNQMLISFALEAARKHRDVFAIREELYQKLQVSPVGSEAGQTLAVALAMFVAAQGDFRQTIIGAVNYGRDNDSYATVAGAIAGAYSSVAAIPNDWIQTVRAANPEPDMRQLAVKLTELVARNHALEQRNVTDLERLLQ
ncbi:MAG: ADP-ribosylglycohydrolase family protein [Deinococcus sp.]|nr:ADP-ribosylglycohydrolase family protein [Deinococcus sp.]